jgi:hypothetical protein
MATVTPTEHPSPLDAPHGTEITPQEARQGFMTGHMRWVLGISVVLAVLVILVAWTAFSHRGASDPHVTTQGAAASSAH